MNAFHFTIAAMALTLAGLAHAGKAERDFYEKEGEPAVKKATETLKTSCGCDVKIDVQMSTLPTIDHLRSVRNVAEDIAQSAPRYCSDAPSKAAICQMKTLEIIGAEKTADFKFANGKATSVVAPNTRMPWAVMAKQLDK